MRSFCVSLAAICALVISAQVCAASDNAIAAYKMADYERAIPLLQADIAGNPNDARAQAALLSALVYQGRADEASQAAQADAIAFPDSPDVIAARGDFAFYMGDMQQAETLYRSALKLNQETARAYYGLSRVFHAASYYRAARLTCLKAQSVDPDDALITHLWLRYLPAERRDQLLPAFAAAHPWLYPHYQQYLKSAAAISGQLAKQTEFELEGGPREVTLHLITLRSAPGRPYGVGLPLRIENARPLMLLLDTGASGIFVSQKAIDKAGLEHLGSGEAAGIGDKGKRTTFGAVAGTCAIASLKFKNCVIEASEGKHNVMGDVDGLLGADVFSDYLVTIDFQKLLLHLKPLPPRPPNAQGYDRVISQEEANFTPVFRFGHELLVSTTLNRKSTGLFLLDTGASISNVDSTFARYSTKVRGDYYTRVSGISGNVRDVFEADKAELAFSHFRQRNLGLTAFNLNNHPEHQEVRLAGTLGMPVLVMFRLTIDYRNGLVDFGYASK